MEHIVRAGRGGGCEGVCVCVGEANDPVGCSGFLMVTGQRIQTQPSLLGTRRGAQGLSSTGGIQICSSP